MANKIWGFKPGVTPNHFEEGDVFSNDKKLRKYFKGMLFKV